MLARRRRAAKRDVAREAEEVERSQELIALTKTGRCGICLEEPRELALVQCGHGFCRPCWQTLLQASVAARCPEQGCSRDLCSRELRRLASKQAFERLERLARQQQLDARIAEEAGSWRPATRPCESLHCRGRRMLQWRLSARRVCSELAWVGARVSGAAGMAAAVGWCRGYSTVGFAVSGALARACYEAKVLPSRGRGLVQCDSCRHALCFECGATCSEHKAADHLCGNDDSDRALQEWALATDAALCPTCGQLIERSAGCNHMRCRCGHHFCWVCGTGYDQEQKQQCRCALYGSRLFTAATATRQAPGLRDLGPLLAAAALLQDYSVSMAGTWVVQNTPWALAVPLIPAAVRLTGWYRSTAAGLAMAVVADGLLPPRAAALAAWFGLTALCWVKSEKPDNAFCQWPAHMGKLPLAVGLSVPAGLVGIAMVATWLLDSAEHWLRSVGGLDGSAPVAFVPLAAVALTLTWLMGHTAFCASWFALGINFFDEAALNPGRSLFVLLQLVALTNAGWQLSADWLLGGAFEWGLLFNAVTFGMLVYEWAFDMEGAPELDVYTRAVAGLVRDLGGRRHVAMQALIAFAALCLRAGVPLWVAAAVPSGACGLQLFGPALAERVPASWPAWSALAAGATLGVAAGGALRWAPWLASSLLACIFIFSLPGCILSEKGRPWVARA